MGGWNGWYFLSSDELRACAGRRGWLAERVARDGNPEDVERADGRRRAAGRSGRARRVLRGSWVAEARAVRVASLVLDDKKGARWLLIFPSPLGLSVER